MAFKRRGDEYDSAFEGDSYVPSKRGSGAAAAAAGTSSSGGGRGYCDPLLQPRALAAGRSTGGGGSLNHAELNDLSVVTIGQTLRYHQSSLTAYDRHKMLVNQYLLYHPGADKLLQRDSSRDKRDMDVVRENHKFLWSEQDAPESWEQQLAKKYYDKLFKEYCICDLSRYKENKIGMRWRIGAEVESGKGQFSCGTRGCDTNSGLRSWEMNFAYVEEQKKKNALIKLRLCEKCSTKLNFCHVRKEAPRKRRHKNHRRSGHKRRNNKENSELDDSEEEEGASTSDKDSKDGKPQEDSTEDDIWKGPAKLPDDKTRDDEFEDYLADLLL